MKIISIFRSYFLKVEIFIITTNYDYLNADIILIFVETNKSKNNQDM